MSRRSVQANINKKKTIQHKDTQRTSEGGRWVLLFQLAQEERCKRQVNKYAFIHRLKKHEPVTSYPDHDYLKKLYYS